MLSLLPTVGIHKLAAILIYCHTAVLIYLLSFVGKLNWALKFLGIPIPGIFRSRWVACRAPRGEVIFQDFLLPLGGVQSPEG